MWRRLWRTTNHEPRTTSREQRAEPGGSVGVAEERPDQLLRRLQWTVLQPLATRLGGDERSLMRGAGLELAEVREYQPGDDVRQIDWNITARTEQPYVREAHTERGLDVWLLVDLSASVAWGTAQCLKRDRAIELAAVAGQLLGRRGNRVGALMFAERPLALVPPAAGRTHLLQLLGSLGQIARQHSAQPLQGRTDLSAALSQASAILRRRSLVLIISDLLVADGWQTALNRLAQRHEVIVARLSDPREQRLPDVGLITLEDPETGGQLLVNTSDRALRKRFQAAAEAQAAQLHSDVAISGADQLVLSTDAALLPALVRFLSLRDTRRRLRTGPGARHHAQRVRT